jgi:hypothetical protein
MMTTADCGPGLEKIKEVAKPPRPKTGELLGSKKQACPEWYMRIDSGSLLRIAYQRLSPEITNEPRAMMIVQLVLGSLIAIVYRHFIQYQEH